MDFQDWGEERVHELVDAFLKVSQQHTIMLWIVGRGTGEIAGSKSIDFRAYALTEALSGNACLMRSCGMVWLLQVRFPTILLLNKADQVGRPPAVYGTMVVARQIILPLFLKVAKWLMSLSLHIYHRVVRRTRISPAS